MTIREIRPGVHAVGAIDWDRRLFDELIPLPDGTSYNSYLVRGNEKVALIDTVDPTKSHELIKNLKNLNTTHIDYVIVNHAEQDHSGSLPGILELYPDAQVVTNPKCKDMLIDLLLIPAERFLTKNDRETLSLGSKTLEFLKAPWVHWPETMFTYIREDKILFTCDFLGSHLATSDLYVADEAKVYESAKRYYAEIMMPFRASFGKYLDTIYNLAVEVIAPSHGQLYQNPQFIMNAYREWISEKVKNEVIIPYVSMHGSTASLVQYLVDALIERNITVKPFNLIRTDIGELAMALVDAATLIIASPTMLIGPHPNIAYAVFLVNALRPKLRYASVIGSYGWGGRMLDQIKGMLTNIKLDFIEPVIVRGYPKEEDFSLLEKLADEILKKHRELGIA
ncbi:MAG: FprA family A-type flavoprotein [Nitrospirota bacterium]